MSAGGYEERNRHSALSGSAKYGLCVVFANAILCALHLMFSGNPLIAMIFASIGALALDCVTQSVLRRKGFVGQDKSARNKL
jgi:hypothetical protein